LIYYFWTAVYLCFYTSVCIMHCCFTNKYINYTLIQQLTHTWSILISLLRRFCDFAKFFFVMHFTATVSSVLYTCHAFSTSHAPNCRPMCTTTELSALYTHYTQAEILHLPEIGMTRWFMTRTVTVLHCQVLLIILVGPGTGGKFHQQCRHAYNTYLQEFQKSLQITTVHKKHETICVEITPAAISSNTITITRFCWLSKTNKLPNNCNHLYDGPHYKKRLQDHTHIDTLKTVSWLYIKYKMLSDGSWQSIAVSDRLTLTLTLVLTFFYQHSYTPQW